MDQAVAKYFTLISQYLGPVMENLTQVHSVQTAMRTRKLQSTKLESHAFALRSFLSILFNTKQNIRRIQRCCECSKGKVLPRTGHEGPQGEQRYSSTISLNSALDGAGGQRHTPASLPPEQTRYPLYRKLGRPEVRSRRVRNISPPQGFDPRTVQPVASRYTVCAIPTHVVNTVGNGNVPI